MNDNTRHAKSEEPRGDGPPSPPPRQPVAHKEVPIDEEHEGTIGGEDEAPQGGG